MEKDLRDAYKALKLMRADLTRTRKENQALADQLAQCDNNNNDTEHALQHELVELQRAYATLAREHETLQLLHAQCAFSKATAAAPATPCNTIHDDSATKAPRTRAPEHAQASVASDAESHNNQETASSARDPIGSSRSSTSSSDDHDRLSVTDASTAEDDSAAAVASLQDEMARKQLELMAKLFALKSERDALAAELVTEQAAFAHERDELCMQLEELSEQLVALQDHVRDVEHDRQFVAEKYAFLSTQLDLTQRHSDALATTETDADDGIERKLRELESIRDQLESERRLLQQQQQQHASQVGSDAKSSSAAATAEGETARRLSGLLQSNASLQHQLHAAESELARLQHDMEAQQCVQTDADDVASANAALTESLKAVTRERNDLQTQCEALERALADKDSELQALAADATTAAEVHAQEAQDLRLRLDALTECERQLRERIETADAAAHAASKQQRAAHEAERSTLEARVQDAERSVAALTAAQQRLEARIAELDAELARRTDDVTRLERAAADAEAQHRAQFDRAAKASAMEAKALVVETRELAQALKLKQDALATADAALDALRRELDEVHAAHVQENQNAAAERECENQDAATRHEALELRLASLETQLMAHEDGLPRAGDTFADATDARMWPAIASHAHALGAFVPQLELVARVISATLGLCAANATALATLSSQHDRALAHDMVAQLQSVRQLQSVVTEAPLLERAQQLNRRVRALLSHWCECVELDASPAPPFGIASREASLVLQNWTRDRSKQLAAKRWLAYMETVSSSHVPSSSSSSASPAINDALFAIAEGSTLELQQLTLEVKQAFLMLIVPILRRNTAIYVRVFTRQASSAAHDTSDNDDDRVWEMKIHVQLCRPQRRASRASMTAPAASPQRRARPPALDLDTSSSLSRQHSFESDASAGAMTPSSSAQKLQIIQQRLQHMQSRD